MTLHHITKKWKFLRCIQGKIVLLLLLLLIPTVIIQAFVFLERFHTRRSEELQANLEMARAVARAFEAFVLDILHQEFTIGLAFTSTQPLSQEEQNKILDGIQAQYSSAFSINWVNPEGVIVSSTKRQFIGLDISDRQYFQDIMRGKDWTISDLVVSKTTGEPIFLINRGIRDEHGQIQGVVVIRVAPDELQRILGVERSQGGAVSLMDTKGMLVYRYPVINVSWEERDWLQQYPYIADVFRGKDVVTTTLAQYENKARIVALTPISLAGWVAGAGRSEEAAMQAITSSLLPTTILFITVTIAAFGVALFGSHRISTSIKRLRDCALALGQGETSESVNVSGSAELIDLSDSFNVMAEKIQLREAALRESEDRLRLAIESAELGTWDFDLVSGDLKWSDRYRAVFGLPPGAKVDYPTFLDRLHPDGRSRVDEIVQQALTPEGAGEYETEYLIVWPDGTQKWIFAKGRAFFDTAKGKRRAVRFIGTVLDISERKQLEEQLRKSHDELELRVQERTTELLRTNAKLETEISERRKAATALQESEEKLRLIAENINDIFWVATPDIGKMVYINPAYEKIWGKSCESLYESPRSFLDSIHPEDVEKVLKIVEDPDGFQCEYRIIKPDGEIRWVYVRGFPVRDKLGCPRLTTGVVTDITERKNAEIEREKLIRELENALANIKTLRELLPICSHCKKIRNDEGYWQQIESYFHQHSGTEFSHGVCPDCMRKHYSEFMRDKL